MKKTVVLFLIMPFVGCITKSRDHDKGGLAGSLIVKDKTIDTGRPGNRNFYTISFDKRTGEKTIDTLFVDCNTGDECMLIWRSDTIAKEWPRTSPADFISQLGAIGFENTFLLRVYEGDGCPELYKLLAFKNDTGYFLSESFGNCEGISSVKIKWPEAEFQFPSFPEAGREARKFVYNDSTLEVRELR